MTGWTTTLLPIGGGLWMAIGDNEAGCHIKVSGVTQDDAERKLKMAIELSEMNVMNTSKN